jgi:hypothetical protein
MSLSAQIINEDESLVLKFWLTEDMINLEIDDGRIISVPIAFYPSLADATEKEKSDFRIFGGGSAIHFNLLDIDLSVESLIMGRKEIPGLMNKFKKI